MTSTKETVQGKLAGMLDSGKAHVPFAAAVKDMPVALRGVVPAGMPYSAWQIVEHIRFTQRDLLDFCQNRSSDGRGEYEAHTWPDDYWMKSPEPPHACLWDDAVASVRRDREEFAEMLRGASDDALLAPFAWGDGQTLMHEALLVLDHAAYHVGELVVVRRVLGAWGK